MQINQSEFFEDTIMDKVVVRIHGKGGNTEEAVHYKNLFHDRDVICTILVGSKGGLSNTV